MTATAEPPNRREPISRRSSDWVWVAVGAVAAALTVIVLWGGYSHRWGWTGINGKTATLWDWLHLLLLPIAVGILPIWFSRRYRLGRRHKLVGIVALAVFVVIVLGGYLAPWRWTGFEGSRLWDWLHLLLLPLLLPLVIVPALTPMATAGLSDGDDGATGAPRVQTAATDPPPVETPAGGDTGPGPTGDA